MRFLVSLLLQLNRQAYLCYLLRVLTLLQLNKMFLQMLMDEYKNRKYVILSLILYLFVFGISHDDFLISRPCSFHIVPYYNYSSFQSSQPHDADP